MDKLTIYQKPTCSTCRDVMERIKAAGVDYDAINYIITPPSREKLAELVRKTGRPAREIIRTSEPEYKSLGLNDSSLTDDQIIDLLAANPSLIQRPIIEVGNRAILARPAERVDEVLGKGKRDKG